MRNTLLILLFAPALAAAHNDAPANYCEPFFFLNKYSQLEKLDYAATSLESDNDVVRAEAWDLLAHLPPQIHHRSELLDHALNVVATDPQFANVAALVFLRFEYPDTWGDVRSRDDLVRLSPERQRQFVSDVRGAFSHTPYLQRVAITGVTPKPDGRQVVTGIVTQASQLAAAPFGEPVHLNVPPNFADHLELIVHGDGVSEPKTRRLEAGPGELVRTEFKVTVPTVRYPPAKIQLTTMVQHAWAGTQTLTVPR